MGPMKAMNKRGRVHRAIARTFELSGKAKLNENTRLRAADLILVDGSGLAKAYYTLTAGGSMPELLRNARKAATENGWILKTKEEYDG